MYALKLLSPSSGVAESSQDSHAPAARQALPVELVLSLLSVADTEALELASRTRLRRFALGRVIVAGLPRLLEERTFTTIVAPLGDTGDMELLSLLSAYRNLGGAARFVLVGMPLEPDLSRWAAYLTTGSGKWVASVAEAAAHLATTSSTGPRESTERVDAPGRERSESAAVRHVTIRLWDSLEVDGVPVYLGAAERNFLFMLASKAGVRISKSEDVSTGDGRRVLATACRRRLGERLGELAELLIPSERGEPYRMRCQREIDAVGMRSADRHAPTNVRVLGRGEVPLVWRSSTAPE